MISISGECQRRVQEDRLKGIVEMEELSGVLQKNRVTLKRKSDSNKGVKRKCDTK